MQKVILYYLPTLQQVNEAVKELGTVLLLSQFSIAWAAWDGL